jgi:hypothetical protein
MNIQSLQSFLFTYLSLTAWQDIVEVIFFPVSFTALCNGSKKIVKKIWLVISTHIVFSPSPPTCFHSLVSRTLSFFFRLPSYCSSCLPIKKHYKKSHYAQKYYGGQTCRT